MKHLCRIGCLVLLLFFSADRSFAQLRNDNFNTLPDPNVKTFRTDSRAFWNTEIAQREGQHFTPYIYTGGLHTTSGSLTSPTFATVAFLPERISETAMTITYGAAAADSCWAIISSQNTVIAGWTRVGTSSYYWNCQGSVTPVQPALPTHSAWLMQLTIAGSAITKVTDRRIYGAPYGVMHVKDIRRYGAIPNNTAVDNRAAMQAAIDALPDTMRLGSEVYVPSGEWTFTCNNANPALLVGSSTTIRGAGRDATFLLTSGTGCTVLGTVELASHITVKDLTVYGPGSTSTVKGVRLINANNNTLENVRITRFNVGMSLEQGTLAPKSTYTTFVKNSIIASNNTTNILGEPECGNVTLSGVTLGGAPATRGIYFPDSVGLTIFGGNCEGVAGPCVEVAVTAAGSYASAVLVQGLFVEENSAAASGTIYLHGFSATQMVQGAVIMGNHFKGAAVNPNTPLYVDYATGVSFIGNYVQSGYTHGDAIVTATAGHVRNFTAFGNSQAVFSVNQFYQGKMITGQYNTNIEASMGLGDIALDNISALRSAQDDGTTTYRLIGGAGTGGSAYVVLSADGRNVQYGRALVALGAGGVATLGATGGGGPAGTAQQSWLHMLDSAGVTMWIPIWR